MVHSIFSSNALSMTFWRQTLLHTSSIYSLGWCFPDVGAHTSLSYRQESISTVPLSCTAHVPCSLSYREGSMLIMLVSCYAHESAYLLLSLLLVLMANISIHVCVCWFLKLESSNHRIPFTRLPALAGLSSLFYCCFRHALQALYCMSQDISFLECLSEANF